MNSSKKSDQSMDRTDSKLIAEMANLNENESENHRSVLNNSHTGEINYASADCSVEISASP